MIMDKRINPPSPLRGLLHKRTMPVWKFAEGLGMGFKRAQLIVDGHLVPLAPERQRIADFLGVTQGQAFKL